MKREDIIRDIHGLEAELAALEDQYGLLSIDFYHFYRAGELEQTRDFIRWAGFYEAKQERENSGTTRPRSGKLARLSARAMSAYPRRSAASGLCRAM